MITKLLSLILALAVLLAPVSQVYCEMPEAMPLSQMAIPESLGKIQDRFQGASQNWVIQIQDVHGHITAQENISAILDHLQIVYGIRVVAVEGGWLASSLPKSWGLPNSREKQMLARALLEDGYLTGPGYAALFSSMPLSLVGVEDQKLYQDNRGVYLQYLNNPGPVDQKISQLSRSIREEKNSIYNSDLLSFDKRLVEFREGSKAESFLPSVVALAGEQQIDLLKLGQIALFSKILEISQTISQEKLKAESDRLTKAFSVKRLSFEELLRSGKIPQEDLEYYPEMKKYIEMMTQQDKLDHVLFFDQIEELIRQVKVKLLVSDEEKVLDQKYERLALLKKLLTFKASPKDVLHFYEDQAAIEMLAKETDLAEALDLSKKFYDYAQQRDEVFFQKLKADERLASNVAIVTGGFHTDGLSMKLRGAGISYVVITPELAGELPNEKLYQEMLQIEPPAQEIQTLAPDRSELREAFDSAFVAGVTASKKGGAVDIQMGRNEFREKYFGSIGQTSTLARQPLSPSFNVLSETNLSSQLETLFVSNTPTPGKPVLPKTARAFVVVEGKVLANLLEQPNSERFMKFATENRSNTFVLISKEGAQALPNALVGMSARLATILEQNLESTFKNPQFLSRYKSDIPKNMAVIGSDEKMTTGIGGQLLWLPEELESLVIFRLALLSDGLRQMVSTPEGYSKVKSLLFSLQVVQEYFGRSA